MAAPAEWTGFLRRVAFFAPLPEEQLREVAGCLTALSFPKGAALFHQGDAPEALYVLKSGRGRLLAMDGGRERTVAAVGRGDVLGELAFLTEEPHRHTAVLDSTAEVLLLSRADFQAIAARSPALTLALAQSLARQLVTARHHDAGHPPSESRLFALGGTAPEADRRAFAARFALALAKQTGRRTLLLDVHDRPEDSTLAALGLKPVPVSEQTLHAEDIQSPSVLHHLVAPHAAGLDAIGLPRRLMDGRLFAAGYGFLAVLRDLYDAVLLVSPPDGAWSRLASSEADRLVAVDVPEVRTVLEEPIAEEKLFRVELTRAALTAPRDGVHARVAWPAEAASIAPACDMPPETARSLDRAARALSGLSIGFAMGSGAAFGYTLIGMLKSLERHGIFPDVVAGTSIGALIGAFYAAGCSPAELEHIAGGITKRKLLTMTDLTIPWQGLVIGGGVTRFLRSVLGERRFEDLALPFACVATDIKTGEEVVMREGRVVETVRASLSLPLFFQPAWRMGRWLVDGGLVNPVPVSTVRALGGSVILAANLTAKPADKGIPGLRSRRRHAASTWKGPTLLEIVAKTLYTMQFEIARARADVAHLTLAPDTIGFTWSDFHRAAELVPIGEEAMEDAIPKMKALLPAFSGQCALPHPRTAAHG